MLLRCLRWLRAKVVQRAERLLLHVLAAGPIPKHVAFVMDGNRRYARMNHKAISQGHSDGFLTLRRLLEACLRLEIRCVSVYAFAMDNFRRSPEEIDHLMHLAHDKLRELSQHGDILEQYGVRLNVLGKTSLLPEYVQEAIRHVESITRNNDRCVFSTPVSARKAELVVTAILNIHMSYSAQDEIATAVESAIHISLDNPSDIHITEKDVEDQLFTSLSRSPPLEVLVRTSGVKRLSDYLLWQCNENTQIHFVSAYWPDFGLWDFVPIVLNYQRKAWGK
ncbi:Alkyl transferase [Mycena indigotica]|uniref:Alkyl transferase n=1 Tax=Mycena indigotica TaxID=2126181 RepID=A0A8H6S9H7_9AGAR|nr:Alkyl transferase [Mycena indigotica]KAF7294660.1 Alkyl transferase [Mycena indigotica]